MYYFFFIPTFYLALDFVCHHLCIMHAVIKKIEPTYLLAFQLYSLVAQLKAENRRLKMIADQADYFADMYQVSLLSYYF